MTCPHRDDLASRIEHIIGTRADQQAAQQRLVVDYYRIRRKLAYPLPVASLRLPDHPTGLRSAYPWATWMLWTLQQRLVTLGTAGQWFNHQAHRDRAAEELLALTNWPRYDQFGKPDLSYAHAIQILHHAHTHWDWTDQAIGQAIRQAAGRAVDAFVDWSDQNSSLWDQRQGSIAPDQHRCLHNISIIGQVALALAARLSQHPAWSRLAARATNLLLAQLDARCSGLSEAVAYDGYVWSFAADLVVLTEPTARQQVLTHPQLESLLSQSPAMAAPGNLLNVAPIGDVEPDQMPFHAAAIAKLLGLVPRPHLAWYLCNCDLGSLRTDALVAIHDQLRSHPQLFAGPPAPAPPRPGAVDAHYATVLRSGWGCDDLAAAISSSPSQFGHMHHDAGHLTIGSAGLWLITDPGYQQYVPSLERDFTLGPTAHNAPLINQQPQTQKGLARRLALQTLDSSLWHTALDLTACYDPATGLNQLTRHVWLMGNHTIVVADCFRLSEPGPITWHWQSHPDAAWWIAAGVGLLHLPDPAGRHTDLWVRSLSRPLEHADLDRHPGSRGPLTLSVSVISQPQACHWWVFARRQDSLLELCQPSAQALTIAGHELVASF